MDSYLQCSDQDTGPGLYHLEKPWVATDMLTPCVFRAGNSLEALWPMSDTVTSSGGCLINLQSSGLFS